MKQVLVLLLNPGKPLKAKDKEDNFLDLQKNTEFSMLRERNKDYKKPYLGKKKRRRGSEVMGNLVCTIEAFEKAPNIVYPPSKVDFLVETWEKSEIARSSLL